MALNWNTTLGLWTCFEALVRSSVLGPNLDLRPAVPGFTLLSSYNTGNKRMSREEEICFEVYAGSKYAGLCILVFWNWKLCFFLRTYCNKCINWVEILVNGAIVEAKLTSPNRKESNWRGCNGTKVMNDLVLVEKMLNGLVTVGHKGVLKLPFTTQSIPSLHTHTAQDVTLKH